MAVPTWKRSVSNTEFLFLLYKLNIRIAEICMNKPKKYRNNYSDAIIKNALDALKFAQMGNSIFMQASTSEQDYFLRRKYFLSAKGLVENISTVTYIFLEHVKKCDSESAEKIDKQERFVGEICGNIIAKLSNVMKSDATIYRKDIKLKNLI